MNDHGSWATALLRRMLVNNIRFVHLSIVVASLFIGAFCAKAQSQGDQLLMITSSSCPWCEAFEEEVGRIYDRTEEAALLPLRRHDFFDSMPNELKQITPATMTPTFIILRDGVEIGRIIGYPGAELFWWRLAEFVKFNTQLKTNFENKIK